MAVESLPAGPSLPFPKSVDRWRPLAWALCVGLAAGCGGQTYPGGTVQGLVTVDGAPVPKGALTFNPVGKGQGPVTGALIEQGKYRCPRVPLGKHTVTFTLQAAEPDRFTDSTGVLREVPHNILPEQYRAGIPAEIVAGENNQDFSLTTTKPAGAKPSVPGKR